ncbi:MAG: enoyl-CoA hydratase/isomerase family protein [Candidatus Rokubacteria bacterium]|nr:enoyl-CoA hydratase/isomerase family protein [Candidatus Rokubacteria bacterium]MBI4255943.1 enoyl-CoA hydratase/isomerase family protein [Candidatus Rokubacteria bacterium]MBI4629423.1 enoyl-CoA hydratase/isomerase family protein [Candidatus Rokubacteria bacterium]
MSYQTLLTSLDEGVARVTLNRPEARNALSAALLGELERALAAYEADPAARVIVLAGAGDRAFCAGADLKGAGDRGTTLAARETFGGLPRILEAIARMRTPVIAQVHGFALAGGCGLAAGCDLIVASDDARFGLPEIKVGVLPLVVMAPILRAVGEKRGMLMVLSGEPVSAREAFEMGLVSVVVPRAELEARTTALARGLARLSPTALGIAKEAAFTLHDMEYTKALRYLRELTTLVFLSDDAKEGIAAFFEKREPRWTGR